MSKGDNDDDEDEYSDEEIADDPDDGEDSQTNKAHNQDISGNGKIDMENDEDEDREYLEEYERINNGNKNDD